MNNKICFNKNLKLLMVKNDLTHEDIAQMLCVTRGTVSNLTRKEKPAKPSMETIAYIARKFNVSIEWLLYGDDYGILKEGRNEGM